MSTFADPHLFVSGNLALNFVGTASRRRTDFADRLATPEDLGGWVVAAGLSDVAPDCAGALERARSLREAVWRMVLAAIGGVEFAPDDRALVNRLARVPPPVPSLDSDGELRWASDVDAALAAVARSAVELLGGPDRSRIKECGRADCTRLYVDTSRAGSRRWCDMTVCGNRAKSAAFRARGADLPAP